MLRMRVICAQKAGRMRTELRSVPKSFTSSKSTAAIPGPTAAAEASCFRPVRQPKIRGNFPAANFLPDGGIDGYQSG